MKKLYFLICYLFFGAYTYAQITVDDTSFSAQQLVEEVLINSPCATTSNWMASTGIIPAQGVDINGIGFFERGTSNFPFERGVVLSSGRASLAGARNPVDPNLNPQSEGSAPTDAGGAPLWRGDNDLENIVGLPLGNTFNASSLSFDFVSQANQISFNFIFASEEYNQNFECQFSDAFAFILTDSSGNSQNLAVVPNTTIPITTMTIRRRVVPTAPGSTGCPAQNPQFFERYNFGPTAASSSIAFNGQTVALTASGTVVPGETYTIKLVVADQSDGAPGFGSFSGSRKF